jgi:hypothetical protein
MRLTVKKERDARSVAVIPSGFVPMKFRLVRLVPPPLLLLLVVVVPKSSRAFAPSMFHNNAGAITQLQEALGPSGSDPADKKKQPLGPAAVPFDYYYNHNRALNAFHQRTQQEKMANYVAQSTYVNTDRLWNLAWHESFVRNDLADLVPPLTEHLNVLVVGDDGGPNSDGNTNPVGLSWLSSGDKASASSMIRTHDTTHSSDSASILFRTALLGPDHGAVRGDDDRDDSLGAEPALGFATYDCILDHGLLDELMLLQQPTTLLLEATRQIREHGVYIALTRQPWDTSSKQYLQNMGDLLGLQWQFDLDGISDNDVTVSVARKYFSGELPSIGKLTNLQRNHSDWQP